jgi:hypothetical protein
MKHLLISPFLFFLVLQLFSPVGLQAQVDRTAITGVVTDPQGHRVPESTVRATERSTGFQRETSTTSQGTYELPGLPSGVYSIQFSKSGFATFTADRVEQTVGQTRTMNVQLGSRARKMRLASRNLWCSSTRWTRQSALRLSRHR